MATAQKITLLVSVLLEEILKLAGTMDIPIIRTDKGELNNLTQNRPHQVRSNGLIYCELKVYDLT
jgi:hypothetical protein